MYMFVFLCTYFFCLLLAYGIVLHYLITLQVMYMFVFVAYMSLFICWLAQCARVVCIDQHFGALNMYAHAHMQSERLPLAS